MGYDCDVICGYSTTKRVRIKDRYLGLLKTTCQLAILGYVIGYVLIYKKDYLEFETPVGAVETSLKAPQTDLGEFSDYPYCAEAPEADPVEVASQLPCMLSDEFEVRHPADSDASLFITTRVTASTQTKENSCLTSDSAPKCRETWAWEGEARPRFILGVENYTVRIRHSWQAYRFYLEAAGENKDQFFGTSKTMQGSLLLPDKGVEDELALDQGEDDIFLVRDLLEASGTNSLDLESEASAGESRRNAGVVLVIQIEYSNLKQDIPTYKYRVTRVPDQEYKVMQPMGDYSAGSRLLLNRHGIKIVFLQTGRIGRFSFTTLAIQLVTALGMLSVATMMVEYIMLYVMPRRKEYAKAKMEYTADFSDIRDHDREIRLKLEYEQAASDLAELAEKVKSDVKQQQQQQVIIHAETEAAAPPLPATLPVSLAAERQGAAPTANARAVKLDEARAAFSDINGKLDAFPDEEC